MNILAIDSALDKSYIGFEYENKRYSKIVETDENYHSLYLISKIKEYSKQYEIDLKKLQALAVNTGVGSFTGIRVALSISKVMANELNIPLIPLTTNQILLKAFNLNYLIMDARRDMLFFMTKDKIELIYKNKINEKLNDISSNEKILCDLRCKDLFSNSICFENSDKDLSLTMLDLGIEKFNKENNKSIFNPLNIEANYIQTPPVF